MSLRKSSETPRVPAPAGPHRKAKPDIYTVLLALALLAILICILFLYLETASYDTKAGPPVGMMTNLGCAIKGQALTFLCPLTTGHWPLTPDP